MAYQDLTHPAQVLNREITATRQFQDRIGSFFARTLDWMIAHSSGQHRLNRVEALRQCSDAELKALRIDRSEIVRHVFRDIYYI